MDRESRNQRIANIIREYEAGSDDAFTELYYETKDDLLRFCNYKYSSISDAASEDIVQMAYIKIANCVGGLDDPMKFLGWACRIVVTTGIDYLRKERKYVYNTGNDEDENNGSWIENVADDSEYAYPEDRAVQREIRDRIKAALMVLDDNHRETFCLYYFDGLKVNEIAAVQSIRPGTVKSRLSHARDKMREALRALISDAD